MTLKEARNLHRGDKIMLPAWWLNKQPKLCVLLKDPMFHKSHEFFAPDKTSITFEVRADDAPGSHARWVSVTTDYVCHKCEKPLKTNGFEKWCSNWKVMENGDVECPDCEKQV